MSFYYDEEEDARQSGEEAAFVCVNCGGTSYYTDAITGALCCDSCFTQSQTQPDIELDVEEVQALAARSRYGQVIGTTARTRTGGGGMKERKPLEEYDTSTPFPDLITCLHGIQQVMKHCITCTSDLVGLDRAQQKQFEEAVQSLWMAYLRAWNDGAEFYGRLHPEIRFSLRDYFLPTAHKTKIMKHLSHRAALIVKKELEGQEEKKDDLPRLKTVPSTEEDVDEHPQRAYSSLPKGHQKSIERLRHNYHQPYSLMMIYWDKGMRGRLEAALITIPSMRLVACLLWLGVSRMGVAPHHILQWIANGAIPLQNAFQHCLSQQEQAALAKVSNFFRLPKLPTLTELENLANKLVVACGLKSFSHLHGLAQNNADSVLARDRPNFSYVTPQSVPLLTARLIGDLGFEQQVLDRSRALMGILMEAPANLWLPAPLKGARPEVLYDTAQVLAVIVVACKMTPGWETWEYPPFPATSYKNESGARREESDSEEDEENVAKRRRRSVSVKSRFVPYNEESFRLLRNGPTAEEYLDYLEENVLDQKETVFPRFVSLLEEPKGDKASRPFESTETENIVRRQPVLKDSRDPLGRKKAWRRQKLHDWHLKLRKKRARWADANGLGEYVVYTDPRVGRSKVPQPEPFHPQYGLLLEYMSYKTHVKPSKIHAKVTALDEEVLCISRPQATSRTLNSTGVGKQIKGQRCLSNVADRTTENKQSEKDGRPSLHPDRMTTAEI